MRMPSTPPDETGHQRSGFHGADGLPRYPPQSKMTHRRTLLPPSLALPIPLSSSLQFPYLFLVYMHDVQLWYDEEREYFLACITRVAWGESNQ